MIGLFILINDLLGSSDLLLILGESLTVGYFLALIGSSLLSILGESESGSDCLILDILGESVGGLKYSVGVCLTLDILGDKLEGK
jgi:hypothetical protein